MDCIKWEEGNIQWDSNPYIWNDVCTLLQAVSAIGYTKLEEFNEITRKYTQKDKKKLVKLVCKINGIDYEDSKWQMSARKITATQIKIAVLKVTGIKIDI